METLQEIMKELEIIYKYQKEIKENINEIKRLQEDLKRGNRE